MAVTPWTVIERLYDSEINAGLQADWDAGITVWLGDSYNGIQIRHTFLRSEFDQIAEWLDGEARRQYPNSDYAKKPPRLLESRGPLFDP